MYPGTEDAEHSGRRARGAEARAAWNPKALQLKSRTGG